MNTPAGAEAFVRFYLGLVNEAWTTPKAGLLPPHSDPGCDFCAGVESDAEQFVASGTRYDGDVITIDSIQPELSPPGQAIFMVDVRQAAMPIVDKRGKAVGSGPATSGTYKVGAEWRRSRWVLIGLERT